jgi:hypothetical protein
MDWQLDPHLQKEVAKIVASLKLRHINPKRVIEFGVCLEFGKKL